MMSRVIVPIFLLLMPAVAPVAWGAEDFSPSGSHSSAYNDFLVRYEQAVNYEFSVGEYDYQRHGKVNAVVAAALGGIKCDEHYQAFIRKMGSLLARYHWVLKDGADPRRSTPSSEIAVGYRTSASGAQSIEDRVVQRLATHPYEASVVIDGLLYQSAVTYRLNRSPSVHTDMTRSLLQEGAAPTPRGYSVPDFDSLHCEHLLVHGPPKPVD